MNVGTFINNAQNIIAYYKNKILYFCFKSKNSAPTIGFVCGFHGKSGGAIAIGSIANMLSLKYNVIFQLHAKSNFNHILSHKVKTSLKCSTVDLFIVDLSISTEQLSELKKSKKTIILSIHGFKDRLHQLNSQHIETVLSSVDLVHFVSSVQQDSYCLPENSYVVIPNVVERINRDNGSTFNIGAVGNLDEPRKGASLTVKFGEVSDCDKIHLWRTNEDYSKHDKVVTHGWENNKLKIYSSFDVLVFLSKDETFGLVVAEALSAGIPCILSNIPAFSVFSECEAVTIFNEESYKKIPEKINQYLNSRQKLSSAGKSFYEKNFSQEVVQEKWYSLIDSLL